MVRDRCAPALLLLVQHLCAVVLAAVLVTVPAMAQTDDAPKAVTRPPDTAQNQVLLAQTIGAIHWLTIVCDGRKDQTWRDHMIEMLELEKPGYRQRQRLVAAFNRGYREQERQYPKCKSEEISAEIRRKAEQGQILSDALGEPYHQ